jgi:hypothetical protein
LDLDGVSRARSRRDFDAAGGGGGSELGAGAGSCSSKTANSGNRSPDEAGRSPSAIDTAAEAASAAGTVTGTRQRGHSTWVPILRRVTFNRLRQFWQRKTTGIGASAECRVGQAFQPAQRFSMCLAGRKPTHDHFTASAGLQSKCNFTV